MLGSLTGSSTDFFVGTFTGAAVLGVSMGTVGFFGASIFGGASRTVSFGLSSLETSGAGRALDIDGSESCESCSSCGSFAGVYEWVLGCLLVSSGAAAPSLESEDTDELENCELKDAEEPFRLSC